MAENVLEKIIKKKSERIVNLKKTISLDSLKELINTNRTFINFKEKIDSNIKKSKFSIIAEIKKASPSAGIIIEDYDPVKIANIYNDNKASCLSVLTEEDFFLGNMMHISKIKKKIELPILCKDFFVDKFQIPLLGQLSKDFSGAEIEQVVIEAMRLGFNDNREFNNEDILISIQNLVPLARTKSKDLDQLKAWAESGNVISASKYK